MMQFKFVHVNNYCNITRVHDTLRKCGFNTFRKQECIPVGCVPSAAVAVSREVVSAGGRGVCLGGCLPRGCLPGGGVCPGGVWETPPL